MTTNRTYQTLIALTDLYEHVADEGEKALVEFIYGEAKRVLSEAPSELSQMAQTIMQRVAATTKQAGGDEAKNLRTALSVALASYVHASKDRDTAVRLAKIAQRASRQAILGATAIVILANSMVGNNPQGAMEMVKTLATQLGTDPETAVDSATDVGARWDKHDPNKRNMIGGSERDYSKFGRNRHGQIYATESYDPEQNRETAKRWHRGLTSFMYAFAQNGQVPNAEFKEGLLKEIQSAMDIAKAKDTTQFRKLQKLLMEIHSTVPVHECMTAGAIAATPMPLGGKKKVKKRSVKEALNDLDLRFLPVDTVAWLVKQPDQQIDAAKEIAVAAYEVGNPITKGALLRADTSVLVLHDKNGKATFHIYPDGGISADGQRVSGHEEVERILGDIPPGQTSADVKPEGDCNCDDDMDNLASPMPPVPEPVAVVVDDGPMTFDELASIS